MLTITIELPGSPDSDKYLGQIAHQAAVVYGARVTIFDNVVNKVLPGDVVAASNGGKAPAKA